MRTLISVAVPAMTFILLVAIGVDLTAPDFARVRRQPALVLTGLFAPLVLLPPAAFALARIFASPPEVTAGVLLLAVCPIGSISNLYSYLANASTALAVTLTGLSCLLASVTIPLGGKGVELVLGRPFEVHAPLALLAAQLLLVLALPVALGLWARHSTPSLALRAAPALRQLSLAGTLLILVLIMADDWAAFVAGLSSTVPLAATFIVASLVLGWIAAVPFSRSSGDRFVVAAEFGGRNIAVATAIAVTLLGRVDFARFAATYSFVEIPIVLGAVALFRALAAAPA